MEVKGPSLPSNYVTILQLKERWLQQQQQNPANSNPHNGEHHSQSNSRPNEEAAFKCTTSRNQNRHRGINQLRPEVSVFDSASKTVVDVANNHPQGETEEHNTDHSNNKQSKKKKSHKARKARVFSKPSEPEPEPVLEPMEEKEQPRYTGGRAQKPRFVADKNPAGGITPSLKPELVPKPVKEKEQSGTTGGRARKHRFVTDQNPAGGITPSLEPELVPELVKEKEQPRSTGGHARKPRFVADQNPAGGITPSLEPESVPKPVKEKEQPRSTGGRARTPRFVADQNPAEGITPHLKPEPVPELVEEKEHRRYTGGRRSWNQKVVREPKHKTTPFVQNSEALLHNAACDDGVVEAVAVAAAVKEINVTKGTNRRWISGKFHESSKPWLSKPPFGVKKVQIWVKKGESAPN